MTVMRGTSAREPARHPAHVTTRNRPYLSVSIGNDHQMWDRQARERATCRAVPPRTDRSGRRHDQQAGCHPNSDDVPLGTIIRYDRRLPQ